MEGLLLSRVEVTTKTSKILSKNVGTKTRTVNFIFLKKKKNKGIEVIF